MSQSSTSSRVYVVDDDAGVLKALSRLLTAAGFDVTTFSQGRQFLDRPPDSGPACLIVDQRMPDLTGLELQRRVAASHRALSIVFMSGHDDIPASVDAMKAGAIDFLVKPIEADQLIRAVTDALASSTEAWMARAELDNFLARVRRLSTRERQVGAAVVRGTPNKQIGWELGITERTVKVHRARLMMKMQVQSVAELVRLVERLHASLEVAPELEKAFAVGSRSSAR